MLKKILPFVPKVLFVISAFLLILTAKGWQYDFDDNSIIRTGILDVHSQPKGARVVLNDQEYGLTPSKITALTPGRYNLILEKTGYHSWQKNVTISPELATQMNDVILFPLASNAQKSSVESYDLISQDRNQQRILTIQSANQERKLIRLVVLSAQSEQLYARDINLDLGNVDLVRTSWSPNYKFAIANFYAASTDSGEPRLLFSLFLDTTQNDTPPADLLKVPALRNSLDLIQQPIWHGSDPIIYPASLQAKLIGFDLGKLEFETEAIIQTPTIPLAMLPASGVFDDPRLIALNDQDDQGLYELQSINLSDESSKKISGEHRFGEIQTYRLSYDNKNIFTRENGLSVITTHLDSDEPTEKIMSRALTQIIGWSPDSERFLFVSESNELAYFDQLKNTFLYPYALTDNEELLSACWHPDNTHIFMLLNVTGEESSKKVVKVIEADGKNLTQIFDDSLDLAEREKINPEFELTCPDSASLLFGTIIERIDKPALKYIYSLAFE